MTTVKTIDTDMLHLYSRTYTLQGIAVDDTNGNPIEGHASGAHSIYIEEVFRLWWGDRWE